MRLKFINLIMLAGALIIMPKAHANGYIGVGGGVGHMHGSQNGKIISRQGETPIPDLKNVKSTNAVVAVVWRL